MRKAKLKFVGGSSRDVSSRRRQSSSRQRNAHVDLPAAFLTDNLESDGILPTDYAGSDAALLRESYDGHSNNDNSLTLATEVDSSQTSARGVYSVLVAQPVHNVHDGSHVPRIIDHDRNETEDLRIRETSPLTDYDHRNLSVNISAHTAVPGSTARTHNQYHRDNQQLLHNLSNLDVSPHLRPSGGISIQGSFQHEVILTSVDCSGDEDINNSPPPQQPPFTISTTTAEAAVMGRDGPISHTVAGTRQYHSPSPTTTQIEDDEAVLPNAADQSFNTAGVSGFFSAWSQWLSGSGGTTSPPQQQLVLPLPSVTPTTHGRVSRSNYDRIVESSTRRQPPRAVPSAVNDDTDLQDETNTHIHYNNSGSNNTGDDENAQLVNSLQSASAQQQGLETRGSSYRTTQRGFWSRAFSGRSNPQSRNVERSESMTRAPPIRSDSHAAIGNHNAHHASHTGTTPRGIGSFVFGRGAATYGFVGTAYGEAADSAVELESIVISSHNRDARRSSSSGNTAADLSASALAAATYGPLVYEATTVDTNSNMGAAASMGAHNSSTAGGIGSDDDIGVVGDDTEVPSVNIADRRGVMETVRGYVGALWWGRAPIAFSRVVQSSEEDITLPDRGTRSRSRTATTMTGERSRATVVELDALTAASSQNDNDDSNRQHNSDNGTLSHDVNNEDSDHGSTYWSHQYSWLRDFCSSSMQYSRGAGLRARAVELLQQSGDALKSMAGSICRGSSEDPADDPTCQQLLLAIGIIGFFPVLFCFGTILYCLTPKEHSLSRRWGVLNVGFATLWLVWAIVSFARAPATERERVVLLGASHHFFDDEVYGGSSGEIFRRASKVLNDDGESLWIRTSDIGFDFKGADFKDHWDNFTPNVSLVSNLQPHHQSSNANQRRNILLDASAFAEGGAAAATVPESYAGREHDRHHSSPGKRQAQSEEGPKKTVGTTADEVPNVASVVQKPTKIKDAYTEKTIPEKELKRYCAKSYDRVNYELRKPLSPSGLVWGPDVLIPSTSPSDSSDAEVQYRKPVIFISKDKILLKGRVKFAASFEWGGVPSPDALRWLHYASRDKSEQPVGYRHNPSSTRVWPVDSRFADWPVENDVLPADFLGVGLRCRRLAVQDSSFSEVTGEDGDPLLEGPVRWLLLWRRYSGLDSHHVVGRTVQFDESRPADLEVGQDQSEVHEVSEGFVRVQNVGACLCQVTLVDTMTCQAPNESVPAPDKSAPATNGRKLSPGTDMESLKWILVRTIHFRPLP
eukprot:Lankesteria_metandrocarpae@DN4574_c0_g1_i1.p1